MTDPLSADALLSSQLSTPLYASAAMRAVTAAAAHARF
jgi:hypothetical protein